MTKNEALTRARARYSSTELLSFAGSSVLVRRMRKGFGGWYCGGLLKVFIDEWCEGHCWQVTQLELIEAYKNARALRAKRAA